MTTALPLPSESAPRALLLDVMSTLVYDPYAVELPAFFSLSMRELFSRVHPTAWVRFERAEIDEQTFFQLFLPDHPEAIDGPALRAMLHGAYRFLDGVEPLLQDLRASGIPMHALSNYPIWYEVIEDKLALSRYLSWQFVSWKTGIRKPDKGAYTGAARALGLRPDQCVFVDDRDSNCRAAAAVGMHTVCFDGDADALRDALTAHFGSLTAR